MKTFPLLVCTVALPCLAADFVNLKFDEPDLSGPLTPTFENGPLEGSAAQIFRGWTMLADGTPIGKSGYSPAGTFGAYHPVGLVDNPLIVQASFGKYSAVLQSLLPIEPRLQLRQTGTIPSDAATLGIFCSGNIGVIINGELIGRVDTSVTAYPEFDISPWAGQTVELEFDFGRGRQVGFDVFGFKPVPEPGTWALLGVGAAAVFYFAGRNRRCGEQPVPGAPTLSRPDCGEDRFPHP